VRIDLYMAFADGRITTGILNSIAFTFTILGSDTVVGIAEVCAIVGIYRT
jgi:hypothetical protein